MTEISYRSEIYRKIFHIFLLILPISYLFFTRQQMVYFLAPLMITIVGADYYRHRYQGLKIVFDKIFGKIMRLSEKEKSLSGISYMCIAAVIVFGFFDKITALNAFTILAISDTCAALVGRRIKTGPFFEKSIAGSIAFFVSAAIILMVYGISFEQNFAYYLFGIFGVFTATIVEARPSLFKIDDNLTIPLSFCIIMFLFNLIWVYN